MIIRILIAFVVLLGAVLLGIQLQQDPGYLYISIHHWIIETTLWFAILALLLFFLLFHVLLQCCSLISKMPLSIRLWHTKRLAQKAQAKTSQGLIEYSEGYWQKAKNHLIQALPNARNPLLNYLTAARAAQKMGDSQLRDQYLREAQQSMPEAKIAVCLTQAQLQLAHHQWEQALATLRHLHDLAPRHPYILKLLAELYEKVRDWPQLIALLPDLKKNRALSNEDMEKVEQLAYLQALIDLKKQNQPAAVTDFFQALPKALAKNPQLVAEYVDFLLKHQDFKQAESLLIPCLRKKVDPELIALYGLLPKELIQLDFAESLLQKNPHSTPLLLCLGKMCIRHQLWGKAKHYLALANSLHPTPTAYAALGSLHEQLNELSLAREYYKQGLELAISESL